MGGYKKEGKVGGNSSNKIQTIKTDVFTPMIQIEESMLSEIVGHQNQVHCVSTPNVSLGVVKFFF